MIFSFLCAWRWVLHQLSRTIHFSDSREPNLYGLQERRPQSHKKIILTKIVIKLKHNIDSCFHMIVLYLLKEKKSRFKRREFSFNIYLVKINSGGPQVFFRWVLLFQMQFVCHIYVLVIIIQDHLTDS